MNYPREYFRKNDNAPGQKERYLRLRDLNDGQALCDELILGKYEEDLRVVHNLLVPLELLENGYRSIDEKNPLMDLLYPFLS
ncbi:MAG: hypothetical protein JW760_04145 [Spirochaetales bacterium]|nr:hypothetical protein [Spirochaetales bacterium]